MVCWWSDVRRLPRQLVLQPQQLNLGGWDVLHNDWQHRTAAWRSSGDGRFGCALRGALGSRFEQFGRQRCVVSSGISGRHME